MIYNSIDSRRHLFELDNVLNFTDDELDSFESLYEDEIYDYDRQSKEMIALDFFITKVYKGNVLDKEKTLKDFSSYRVKGDKFSDFEYPIWQIEDDDNLYCLVNQDYIILFKTCEVEPQKNEIEEQINDKAINKIKEMAEKNGAEAVKAFDDFLKLSEYDKYQKIMSVYEDFEPNFNPLDGFFFAQSRDLYRALEAKTSFDVVYYVNFQKNKTRFVEVSCDKMEPTKQFNSIFEASCIEQMLNDYEPNEMPGWRFFKALQA